MRADCSQCFGLCCVIPTFAVSADFALNKPAGKPCPHLQVNSDCAIHDELRPRGFAGCTVYDCFGAGQQVSQVTFAGQDWRTDPEAAAGIARAFAVVRDLHELLWYLDDALARPEATELTERLRTATTTIAGLVQAPAAALVDVDVLAQRRSVEVLLTATSERVRASAPVPRRHHLRADLVGARLAHTDLRGGQLRGALLIAADLAGADLRWADILGADLRGADVRGADLSSSLFLTQLQVNAARGDAATLLPDRVTRPAHWSHQR